LALLTLLASLALLVLLALVAVLSGHVDSSVVITGRRNCRHPHNGK
jgi:hypothetical protein